MISVIVTATILGLCVWIYTLIQRINTYKIDILNTKEQTRLDIERARKDAVDSSRRVLKGKITEELCPLLPGFPFIASDLKFMGMPLDYVAFVGYSDVRDGDGEDIEIVFIDVKTGKASLSRPQRKIKEAVIAKRVSGMTLRVKDGVISTEEWKSKELPNESSNGVPIPSAIDETCE